jgi:hypothetical protein
VAHLASGLRWEVADGAPDATLANRIPYLLSALEESLDADTIAERLGAKKGGVQNALKMLVKSGAVVRLGMGTKGSPYSYAHPSVAGYMTKDDEWDDAYPGKAQDESDDEYSPATQGEMAIRHLHNGYIPARDDESFSRPVAAYHMTRDDG